MPKQTVVLLFGGRSSEHTISCATAGGVLDAIDRDRYTVIPVGITREGAFTLEEDRAAKFTLNPDAMPEVVDNGSRILWPQSTASKELRVVDASGEAHSLGDVDVVFPILHGPWGEDGTLQGMLELLGLPYVGDGVLASALAMDKHFAKIAFAAAGIPVAPGVTVSARQWATSPSSVVESAAALGWPVFVKPARAGSSVGVTRVESALDLAAAMAIGLAEDSKVLIEAAIVGREIECGVLSGRGDAAPRVSVAGEIVVSGRAFYDFDAKYLDAPGIDLVCPAEISDAEASTLRQLAARAFDAIGGSGLARADFFLTESGWVINEINTMPGFTPISMFPKCWLASGMSYPELIDELITLGLETVR
ncbi:D-alanine--D-alanine ligase family protein [Glaciihabitans sp. dw_435]|uniref:D-alanine--D-alanine ligase family protein n=1 Tax=Glaciihabitans sp. dw_435 TaxID=2720081 RepID=UPI001BD21C57|nr:D-alanine--D-alanine ligase family protein [Glaciihabitans sp. dw_435]